MSEYETYIPDDGEILMSSKRNRGPLLLGTGGKYFVRCNHLGKELLLNVLGLVHIHYMIFYN